MGFAIKLATTSGLSSANLLGSSSPMMSEVIVIPATTSVMASMSECWSSQAHCESHSDSPLASVASPKAPLVMPIKVIPTCIVERNKEGSFANASAASAPGRLSSAHCWRRALRDETTAISDIAKTPFTTIRTNRIRSSTICVSI